MYSVLLTFRSKSISEKTSESKQSRPPGSSRYLDDLDTSIARHREDTIERTKTAGMKNLMVATLYRTRKKAKLEKRPSSLDPLHSSRWSRCECPILFSPWQCVVWERLYYWGRAVLAPSWWECSLMVEFVTSVSRKGPNHGFKANG